MRKAALQAGHKGIIGAVVDVPSPLHLAEGRIRPQAGGRIDEVDIGRGQQVGAFASDIGESTDEVMGKRSLHGELPIE